jgi:hypothetical protein
MGLPVRAYWVPCSHCGGYGVRMSALSAFQGIVGRCSRALRPELSRPRLAHIALALGHRVRSNPRDYPKAVRNLARGHQARIRSDGRERADDWLAHAILQTQTMDDFVKAVPPA